MKLINLYQQMQYLLSKYALVRKQLIGVNLAEDSLQIIQLSSKETGWQILEKLTVTLADGVIEDGQIIKVNKFKDSWQLVTERLGKFERHLAISIPDKMVELSSAVFPATYHLDKIYQIIGSQIDKYFPGFLLEQIYFDCYVKQRNDNEQQVAIYAAKKEYIENNLTIFKQLGYIVALVEPQSIAKLRCLNTKLSTMYRVANGLAMHEYRVW